MIFSIHKWHLAFFSQHGKLNLIFHQLISVEYKWWLNGSHFQNLDVVKKLKYTITVIFWFRRRRKCYSAMFFDSASNLNYIVLWSRVSMVTKQREQSLDRKMDYTLWRINECTRNMYSTIIAPIHFSDHSAGTWWLSKIKTESEKREKLPAVTVGFEILDVHASSLKASCVEHQLLQRGITLHKRVDKKCHHQQKVDGFRPNKRLLQPLRLTSSTFFAPVTFLGDSLRTLYRETAPACKNMWSISSRVPYSLIKWPLRVTLLLEEAVIRNHRRNLFSIFWIHSTFRIRPLWWVTSISESPWIFLIFLSLITWSTPSKSVLLSTVPTQPLLAFHGVWNFCLGCYLMEYQYCGTEEKAGSSLDGLHLLQLIFIWHQMVHLA